MINLINSKIIKIFFFLLIAFFSFFWIVKKIFFNNLYKSKATVENLTFSFDPNTIKAPQNSDFTVTLKIKPQNQVVIQFYKIDLVFDKSKVKIKDNGITYLVGRPSIDLGADTNETIPKINGESGEGLIKLYGEIVDPNTGLLINSISPTDVARITFTSKTDSGYSIYNKNSFAVKVNGDYTVESVNFSNDVLGVNGITISQNPVISSGLTPTPISEIYLNLKLKLQGINNKPIDSLSSINIKLKLKKEGSSNLFESEGSFTADSGGIWSGTVGFNIKEDLSGNWKFYIKGPQHIQKKICDSNPAEQTAGTYSCNDGKINIIKGQNNFDFSKIIILVGDLDQNGITDSVDFSLVKNNLGKTDIEILKKADLNRDGKVDTQDFSLILYALSIRPDEM